MRLTMLCRGFCEETGRTSKRSRAPGSQSQEGRSWWCGPSLAGASKHAPLEGRCPLGPWAPEGPCGLIAVGGRGTIGSGTKLGVWCLRASRPTDRVIGDSTSASPGGPDLRWDREVSSWPPQSTPGVQATASRPAWSKEAVEGRAAAEAVGTRGSHCPAGRTRRPGPTPRLGPWGHGSAHGATARPSGPRHSPRAHGSVLPAGPQDWPGRGFASVRLDASVTPSHL